ncbi:type 1 glutamine amidotransferase [Streptomyces scabiei]|uniref:type 1 glutamine amidotransferase n=1 Tax=Streptomyces scabiei TaxID=1930 RepID=UPI0036E64E58
MPRLLMVAHDHLSPGGAVSARFEERGYEITELLVVPEDRFDDPAVEVTFPDPREYDALLVLGAKWSVYGDEVAGWVKPELEMIRAADDAGVPVFGICFGGQLLAQAHGGSVEPSRAPEIGLHAVQGEPAVDGLWFEWHFDGFTPPPDATVIGRNAAAPQAFVLRRNLGLQFHPEVDADGLKGWLGGGGREGARALGLDPDVLVERVRATDPATRARAAALVDHFLDVIAVR